MRRGDAIVKPGLGLALVGGLAVPALQANASVSAICAIGD